jgi:hypothetical protein
LTRPLGALNEVEGSSLLVVLGVDFVGVRRARGDIIDVRRGIVLEVVDGIDPTARALLDRPSRLVILLRTLLVAETTGRRGWAEVRAAIAASWSGGAAGPTRAEATAAATWSRATESPTATAAKPTAATGSWSTKASARTRREASRAGRPRAIFSCPCFADCQRTALERLRVELTDDFLSLFAVGELHECESAGTTSLAIDRHGNVRGLSDGREVGAEIRLTRTVGKVPDEQTDCQGLLVKSPVSRRGFDSISKTHLKSQRAKGKGQG